MDEVEQNNEIHGDTRTNNIVGVVAGQRRTRNPTALIAMQMSCFVLVCLFNWRASESAIPRAPALTLRPTSYNIHSVRALL